MWILTVFLLEIFANRTPVGIKRHSSVCGIFTMSYELIKRF